MNLFVISFITDPAQSIVSKAVVMAENSLTATLTLDTAINPDGEQFIRIEKIQKHDGSIVYIQ